MRPWPDTAVAALEAGDLAMAIKAFLPALALSPTWTDGWIGFGLALRRSGNDRGALMAYVRAATTDPRDPRPHFSLGNIFLKHGEIGRAGAAFRQTLVLAPGHVDARVNLAATCHAEGDFAAAARAAAIAMALAPADAAAIGNCAAALRMLGQDAAAIRYYDRALILEPTRAEWLVGKGALTLAAGDWVTGFRLLEARQRLAERQSAGRAMPGVPWAGEQLGSDRTLLLTAEQGIGDAIQFLRFLPTVAACAPRIVVEVPPTLTELARSIDVAATIVATGDPLPRADYHAPLMSVAAILRTTEATLPNAPYIQADATRRAVWSQRLQGFTGRRVGVVWAGNPVHREDRLRSVPATLLAPLALVPNVAWFSLQVGRDPTERPKWMQDAAPALRNFADTAAAIAELDLVISVDTAVAHLAGAMGKPVWTLLAFASDWRWLRRRLDTPWYPSMRLFRQQVSGDWPAVINDVCRALADDV